MHYDELELNALRALQNEKWSAAARDQIPMWVAEMDFPVAAAITDGLSEFVTRGGAGYPSAKLVDAQRSALVGWYRDAVGVELAADRMIELSSVLAGLDLVVRKCVPDDGAVIVPTPSYMPFLQIPDWLDRRIITVPMLAPAAPGERYRYDLDGIERAFGDGGRLLIVCNPHNPTGALLTRPEAERLGEIVDAHGGYVFSDEIHVPLTFSDSPRFISYAAAADANAAHSFTALSASKGWNIPGLKCATLISPSLNWSADLARTHPQPSSVGLYASQLAFAEARDWLAKTTAYIRENIAIFTDFARSHAPEAAFTPPEATYLAWIDLGFLRPGAPETVASYVTEETGIVATSGVACGAPGFLRVNLATSKPVLYEALDRLGGLISRRRG